MSHMQPHCFAVLIAPIGCEAHFVATLDLTLSRLHFVDSLSRQVSVEQRLSDPPAPRIYRAGRAGWTKRNRLRVETKCFVSHRFQLTFLG